VAFGIVLILAGAAAAALAAVTAAYAGLSLAHPSAELALPLRSAIPSLATYLLAAVSLVWLGVGSICRRRWARQLIVVAAWLWLGTGVAGLAVAVMAWSPTVTLLADLTGLPAAWAALTLAVVAVASAVVEVVLPALMIAYYQRSEVVAACAAVGPARQWCDGVSSHALSLALVALAAAFSLALVAVYDLPLPLFGLLVDGWPRSLLVAAGIAASLALARGTLLGSRTAWALGVAATVVAGAASTVTIAAVEPVALVAGAALSAAEVELLTAVAAQLSRTSLVLVSLLSWGTLLAYQLWVRPAVTAPGPGREGDR
jgi:hypothetical protein